MKSQEKIYKKFLMFSSVLIILVGIGIVQIKNLTFLYDAQKYPQQQLVEKLIQDQVALAEFLQKSYSIDNRDITIEEEDKLRQGDIQITTLIAKYGYKDLRNIDDSEHMSLIYEDSVNANVDEAVNQMLSLKAKYLDRLVRSEKQAIKDYLKIPIERRSNLKKWLLAYSYLAVGGQIERQSDIEVEICLRQLEVLLKNKGESTEIVDYLRDYYEKEKVYKKIYYYKRLTDAQ